jgi:hypothetical protein
MQLSKQKGQDKFFEQIITNCIKELGIICNSKDYDDKFDENRPIILENLEKINTFSSEKDPLISGILLNYLDEIERKAFSDQEVTEVNEKILYNILKLKEKALNNGELAKKKDGLLEFMESIFNVIKNKSHYRDPFLTALKIFSNLMLDNATYESVLEKSVNESLIDALFNASDNYLDDISVTSEINNCLCMICLRSDKNAAYIVKKGGLQNIVEELKSIVNLNDPLSQSKKMFGLKFIESLVKDGNNMNKFIELKGNDLIHNLMKNCLNQSKEDTKTKMKELIGNINNNDNYNDNSGNKNYNKEENDDKFGSEILRDMNNKNKSELNIIEKLVQNDNNNPENLKNVKNLNDKINNLNCFNNYITETCINVDNLGVDSNSLEEEKSDKNLSNNSLETNHDSNTSGSVDGEEDLFNHDDDYLDNDIDSNENKKNDSNYLVHCFRIIMMNLKQNKKDFVDNRLFGNITLLLKYFKI